MGEAPDRETLLSAAAFLKRQLPDLTAAAIPTKSEVYIICGGNARAMRDAIEVVLAALPQVSA